MAEAGANPGTRREAIMKRSVGAIAIGSTRVSAPLGAGAAGPEF
jgi:hypothetical protein